MQPLARPLLGGKCTLSKRATCSNSCNSASAAAPRLQRCIGAPLIGTHGPAGSRNGSAIGAADKSTTNVATSSPKIEGASTDLAVIFTRLQTMALPYWTTSEHAVEARWKLAGVVGLTLATTGVSVMFNFLGRDFFNYLAEKDAEHFFSQLYRYLGGFAVGIPVFVLRDYYQGRLALQWRQWMTQSLLQRYLEDRSFYTLQSGALVDNPDQRISSDVKLFTETALSFSLTLLNASIDLLSFSAILYATYPPLFGALLAYSAAGTGISLYLGRSLVGLNFNQEAREADFRYGLVRVRENAESIAFYGGEASEQQLLLKRLSALVQNQFGLLGAARNLDFFTSFYRYLIQLLPAAVVAPLFFAGKIEFGVINQSQSAFNHILNDVSLVVYQIQAIAGFSAVVDRLGEFSEVVDIKVAHPGRQTLPGSSTAAGSADVIDVLPAAAAAQIAASSSADTAGNAAGISAAGAASATGASSNASSSSGSSSGSDSGSGSTDGVENIRFESRPAAAAGGPLLELRGVSIVTPNGQLRLVQNLNLEVIRGRSLLIMGASGAGKTSVLRALAGLWPRGSGAVVAYGLPGLGPAGHSAAANGHPSGNGSSHSGGGADAGGAGRAAAGSGGADGQVGSGGSVLFLPQKPYMVLGCLRDQLLYPTWPKVDSSADGNGSSSSSSGGNNGGAASTSSGNSSSTGQAAARGRPSDAELEQALRTVALGALLERCAAGATLGASPLDYECDWSGVLSLGEQQRLAFARLLLARPPLALLDEATSALDGANERRLYEAVATAGVTCVSVGHRPSLMKFHDQVLQMEAGGGWKVLPAAEAAAAAALVPA